MMRVFADTAFYVTLVNPRDRLHGVALARRTAPGTAVAGCQEATAPELGDRNVISHVSPFSLFSGRNSIR